MSDNISIEQQIDELNTEGVRLWRAGQRPPALDALEQAIALLRDEATDLAADTRLTQTARTQNNRGNVLRDMGQRKEALTAYDETIAIYHELAKREPEAFRSNVAMTQNNRGNVLADMGRQEEALTAYDNAVAIYRELAKHEPTAFRADVAMTQNNRGNVLRDMGQRKEALTAYDETTAIYRELAKREPEAFGADVAMTQNNRGNVLADMGRREEALTAYDEALATYRELAKREPEAFRADVAMTQNNRGTVLHDMGEREEALTAYDETLAIYRELAEREPEAFRGDLAMTQNNRGNVLADLERRDEALTAYDEALAIRRELAEREPRAFRANVANAQNNRGAVFADMGRREEALTAYDEALAIRRELAEHEPEAFLADVAMTQNNRGILLPEMERDDEARAAYNEALAIYRELAEREPRAFVQRLTNTLFNEAERLKADDPLVPELLAEAERMADLTSDSQVIAEIKTRASALRHDVSLQQAWQEKSGFEGRFRSFLRKQHEALVLPGLDGVTALGVLQCLRKWASYTPIPLFREDQKTPGGGGFYLRWRDHGICVDPGFDFGRMFRKAKAQWGPRDIDLIICSHHHIDHTGDMLALMTCLFEMNEDGSHEVDFLLSSSAFAAHADMLAFLPGVRRLQLLKSAETVELPDWLSVTPVKASHRDLTGRNDGSVGFLLELQDNTGVCRVGFSGDTAPLDAAPAEFIAADLLVMNVGSIYPTDVGLPAGPKKQWHLGINGVIEYLRSLKSQSGGTLRPLVLVSEWGEELEPYRVQLCRVIAERVGIPPEQVWPSELEGKVALWPDKAAPVCSHCNTRVAEVAVMNNSGDIEYHCETGAHT